MTISSTCPKCGLPRTLNVPDNCPVERTRDVRNKFAETTRLLPCASDVPI